MSSIRVGVYPDDYTEHLVWDTVADRWIGNRHIVIDQIDADPLGAVFHVPSDDWSFVGLGFASSTYSWGYRIDWLRKAKELYAAGLRLQERLSCRIGQSGIALGTQIVAYYYQYNPGDQTLYSIPPTALSGPTHLGFGTALDGPISTSGGTSAAIELDGGWKNLNLVPTRGYLYPDLYLRVPTDTGLHYPKVLNAQLSLRWVSELI
jgi:hypothetical protein